MKKILLVVFAIVLHFVLIGCASTSAAAKGGSSNFSTTIANKYTNKGFAEANMASWGALNCHDPKLFQDDDGTYYIYSTDASIGGAGAKGLQIRKSKDLVTWTCSTTTAIRNNWDKEMVDWTGQEMGSASSWAPTVIKQNGKYYMFHGMMLDGLKDGDDPRPTAWIGLAISDKAEGPFIPAHKYDPATYKQSTLVRYTWSQRPTSTKVKGVNYRPCKNCAFYSWHDGFGAIDPEFVIDVATSEYMKDEFGNYYMTYGSFKEGIALITVDGKTFKPAYKGEVFDKPLDEIDGAWGKKVAGGFGACYEGSQMIYNSRTGYYYMFCSCGALEKDYSIRVGRSKSVTGPFLDAQDQDMAAVSGETARTVGHKILGGFVFPQEFGWRSLGGMSILNISEKDELTGNNKIVLCAHARTSFLPNYFFYAQTRQLYFNEDGWPVLNPNEYTGEGLRKFTKEEIAGYYDTVLTVRDILRGDVAQPAGLPPIPDTNIADGYETNSQDIILSADGKISGNYEGTWSLSEDGYSITFNLEESGKKLGVFKGIVTDATDWGRKDSNRKTISFTTVCGDNGSLKSGEHFFGNRCAIQ